MARIEILEGRNILLAEDNDLNADKHSPASSARSTKRRVRGDAYVSGSWKLPLTDREATAFMSK